MFSRKHWRGRLPPNFSEPGADIQWFEGEAVNVTAVVVVQRPAVSDVDVAAYGPRAEGIVDHLLMIADHLNVLR